MIQAKSMANILNFEAAVLFFAMLWYNGIVISTFGHESMKTCSTSQERRSVKEYELTILIRSDLEADVQKVLDKVGKIVTDNKGKVVETVEQGKKRLEYKIKNETHAIFHLLTLELPAEAVGKIDSVLNITEDVLRHLIVKVDAKKVALIKEAAKAAKKDEE
jgi:small subunit ribosomal protein S6